ncbi:interleukin-11 [Emydura macquarii macquarii]|uniref:interleukin-11 n=1 Tax=Emydura macquarii macquarii TaxID=1129001 RepID=UPI00352B7BDC
MGPPGEKEKGKEKQRLREGEEMQRMKGEAEGAADLEVKAGSRGRWAGPGRRECTESGGSVWPQECGRPPWEENQQPLGKGGHSSLCRLLVALLSLCEGLGGHPALRLKPSDPRADLDSIISLAKNLLSDTKHLFHLFKSRYPAEGEHKMDTLPMLSMSAVELSSIQVPGGLARLSADLQNYQKHVEWLRRAGSVLRPLELDLGALHARLERLLKRLEHLMFKLSLPRPTDPLPSLPSHGTHWAVVQAGHALFHSLHLYLDWTARALVLIRNKL